MDSMLQLQTPPKSTISDAENTPPPIPNQPNSSSSPINSGKNGTPDRLKVPKPFKYAERYTSPTDQMMSPVSRGILARGRKASKLLPPSAIVQQHQHKIQALQLQDSTNPLPNSRT